MAVTHPTAARSATLNFHLVVGLAHFIGVLDGRRWCCRKVPRRVGYPIPRERGGKPVGCWDFSRFPHQKVYTLIFLLLNLTTGISDPLFLNLYF